MIEFEDPFGRRTIIEIPFTLYNRRVGCIVRKERQTIYESWDLVTAKAIVNAIQDAIKNVEEKNVIK